MKPERCSICGGDLIGAETNFGTCGHCGGRSRKPDPARRLVSTLTFDYWPSPSALEQIETLFEEEGYEEVGVTLRPPRTKSDKWTALVRALGNPYLQEDPS